MIVNGTEYFLLINYKTKERYLCSLNENEPDFYGQKVWYIGIENGLGGYRTMLAKGFVDRRDISPMKERKIKTHPFFSMTKRIQDYYEKKWKKRWEEYDKETLRILNSDKENAGT